MSAREAVSQKTVPDQALAQILYSPLYRTLSSDLQELVRVSVSLYSRERRQGLQFPDYSFIVFPMAKAYEGFLKQYLLQMQLLTPEEYHDRRFRIGRALNPDLRNHQRDEQWLYDDLARLCSPNVSRLLWDTWLQCRNRVFHFFPASKQSLTLAQAGEYLVIIISAMTEATRCQRELRLGSDHNHERGHQPF